MKKRGATLGRRNSNVFSLFDQKQITELKEAFTFIDRNGDGVLDRDDLSETWSSLGSPMEGGVLDAMLAESPGSLNFTMFLAMLGDQLQGYNAAVASSAGDLLRAFEHFDRQRVGRISTAELREALITLGDRMTDEEAAAILQEAPTDAEGQTFDYRELVRLLKAPL